MPYVMIRHEVASYAKWKRAVHDFKKIRQASGEKCFYACRGSKNPNDVLVWCEWDTTPRMKKFVKSLELRKAMKAAGVISKPEISFWSGMDDLSVG